MRRNVMWDLRAPALALAVVGCALEPFPIPAPVSPGPPCAGDAECEDSNPCTDDRCEASGCTSTPVAEGTDCSDENACNGAESCSAAGQCAAGPKVTVDDGNMCTVDECDPTTGTVIHTPKPGCGTMTDSVVATAITGAPSARQRHSALWTGTRMIVWGGSVPTVTATGGLYDPATDTWKETTSTGAPPPRHSHRAVWTGSKMIVWGGYGTTDYESTGGVYDPASGAWASMSTAGAPMGRTDFAATWTGTKLVVFGGLHNGGTIGGGGVYDLATDTWTALPFAGSPSARYGCTGVWTGKRAIFWGGNDLFDWHQDGGQLDPGAAAAVWLGGTDTTDAPERREAHLALWTGKAMLIWGGWNGGNYLATGGLFDPAADADGSWEATSPTGAPSARAEHAAVWTGDRMVVWGGCGTDTCATLYADGGAYTPGAGGGAWTPIAAHKALTARRNHTAVWTDESVIVWGGLTAKGITATGARFKL